MQELSRLAELVRSVEAGERLVCRGEGRGTGTGTGEEEKRAFSEAEGGGYFSRGEHIRIVPTGWDALDGVLRSRHGVAYEAAQEDVSRDTRERSGVRADGLLDQRGGLVTGAIHECLGMAPAETGAGLSDNAGTNATSVSGSRQTHVWVPPMGLLVHLAARAAQCPKRPRSIVWIGRRVWPYACSLVADGACLARCSLFLDPPNDAARVWAIDLALRSEAFGAVVADGSGLKMPQTRRLQLAAAARGGFGLLARPPWERNELSAATTRWWINRVAHPLGEHEVLQHGPRWRMSLLRCKGRQVLLDRSDHGGEKGLPRSWMLEQDRGKGVVRLSTDVVGRPHAAPVAARVGSSPGRARAG